MHYSTDSDTQLKTNYKSRTGLIDVTFLPGEGKLYGLCGAPQ